MAALSTKLFKNNTNQKHLNQNRIQIGKGKEYLLITNEDLFGFFDTFIQSGLMMCFRLLASSSYYFPQGFIFFISPT
jgi:hypothetical protein